MFNALVHPIGSLWTGVGPSLYAPPPTPNQIYSVYNLPDLNIMPQQLITSFFLSLFFYAST